MPDLGTADGEMWVTSPRCRVTVSTEVGRCRPGGTWVDLLGLSVTKPLAGTKYQRWYKPPSALDQSAGFTTKGKSVGVPRSMFMQ